MVEHHCPHTRRCIPVLGLHTDEEYSSFDRISKFYVVSLTSGLHGPVVLLIQLTTIEAAELFSVA